MNDLPSLPDATFLGGRQRRQLGEASLKGLGFSQPAHISRLGGRFHLVGETGEYQPVTTFDPQIGAYIDMVIVDVNENRSKIYFDRSKPYDANREDPPLCFSDNGVAPSVNAIQPQHETCAGCPQNVKGSAISGLTGAEVWACKDQKKLAVIVNGIAGVWLFVIPPASLKKYRAYVEWIVRQQLPGANRAADPADMITRVFFNQGSPNVLEFRAEGLVTAEIAALQDKLWETGATDAIVGRNDQPRTKPLPALPGGQPERISAPQATNAAPAQLNAPAASATASQPQAPKPEPPKRRAKKGGYETHPLDVPAFIQADARPEKPAAAFGIQPAKEASTDMAAKVRAAFKLA